jgi:hypothetical protein
MNSLRFMEFDWSLFQAKEVKADEVAESFEDPFSLRFLPDEGPMAVQTRFFCLGKSLKGHGLFTLYNTNGKQIKAITSRPMSEEEDFYYNRKLKEFF